MKVYVVTLVKNGAEEILGVRRSPEEANILLDNRYGCITEYETNPKVTGA